MEVLQRRHTTCECGQAPETINHMLQYPLLAHPCTLDDLQSATKMCRQMEECRLKTRKKKTVASKH